MTEHTPIDAAHAAMEAAPEDDAARLRFYERLADSELFLALEREAEGERITPQVFEVAGGSFVLAFDREERLAAFAGGPAPYAALSGRVIAAQLAPAGLGLALNLGAPSEILIPNDAVTWLAETVAHTPDEAEAQVAEVNAPLGLPEALLTALDAKLATATGRASGAYLVGVTYDSGARGHLLGFVDAVAGAEAALAKAVSEALTFSGIEAGALDVSFFRASDAMAARLARHGLRFDLPQPEERIEELRPAPGSDPDSPPILR